jgi:hypothetical protein
MSVGYGLADMLCKQKSWGITDVVLTSGGGVGSRTGRSSGEVGMRVEAVGHWSRRFA